jgi:hypothetical protein
VARMANLPGLARLPGVRGSRRRRGRAHPGRVLGKAGFRENTAGFVGRGSGSYDMNVTKTS